MVIFPHITAHCFCLSELLFLKSAKMTNGPVIYQSAFDEPHKRQRLDNRTSHLPSSHHIRGSIFENPNLTYEPGLPVLNNESIFDPYFEGFSNPLQTNGLSSSFDDPSLSSFTSFLGEDTNSNHNLYNFSSSIVTFDTQLINNTEDQNLVSNTSLNPPDIQLEEALREEQTLNENEVCYGMVRVHFVIDYLVGNLA